MPPTQEKLDKAKSKFANVEKFTEFLPVFRRVMDLISQLERRQNQLLASLEKKMNEVAERVKGDADTTLNDLKKKSDEGFQGEEFRRMSKQLEQLNKKIDNKVASVKDGKDANPDDVAFKLRQSASFLEKIKGRKPTEQEIRIAMQPFADKLKKELDEKLLKISRTRVGGYTDNHVVHSMGRVVKTETPSGTIDGNNTDFTTTQQIHAILSYHLHGKVVPSTDYTIQGNTISWNTAPDAIYSSSDHEVVYI